MYKERMNFYKIILNWLIVPVIIGIIGGIVGTAFHISVDFVTELRMEYSWLVYLLPIGGLLIAFLYLKSKSENGIDTNRVIRAVKSEADVPLKMMPLIFVSTVVTHLFGGSAGREGAALQLGGSIGYNISKAFKTDKLQIHLAVMSGMSAVFSALFGTSVAASIFSFEVARVRLRNLYELIPCLISSFVAGQIARIFGVSPIRFNIVFPEFKILTVLKIAVLAILCGLIAYLFCFLLHKSEYFAKKIMPNMYMRAFVGGVLIIILTMLARSNDYNGAGMNIINRAIDGQAISYAFMLKIIFTVICVSCCYKGGEIVPAFFIGSTFGCTAAPLLNLSPQLGACIGFVALFCGVVNCPFASFIIALEIFGGKGVIFFVIACLLSFFASGNISLYKNQGKYIL